MWQYLFLQFRQQRGRNALAGSGFLLAACALILLSATTQTTVLQTNRLVTQNWRPTYDLVVLPPQAQLPSGKAIPADTLQGYNSGISTQQYQQVKQIAGVEVAAPIAFLGYVQLPSPAVQFSPEPLATGYYRVDWTLTAFNGHRSITERRESFFYNVAATCDVVNRKDNPFDSLRSQNVRLESCGSNDEALIFPSIDTGTFLFAAIDPVAENQLVHLDKSVVTGRMLTSQDTIHLDPKKPVTQYPGEKARSNYNIPILFHQQLPGQITLHATFSRITTKDIDPQQVLDQGGFSYLTKFPNPQTLFDQNVPLVQNDPQRFSNAVINWDGKTWQPLRYRVGSGLTFLYTPSGLTYQTIKSPAGQSDSAYTLVPSNTQSPGSALSQLPLQPTEDSPYNKQGPEVAFRNLQPAHILDTNTQDNSYAAQPVGQFTEDTLSAQFGNALNWLPETTYTSPPITLRYDAQGRPVAPTNLIPTTNPAGFTLQPPLALTTLAAGQKMKGDKLISVIRVRVAGVNTANEESWKRVAQIAQAIRQQTGLRAVVTLGSSPQQTLVYVPGINKGQYGSTHAIEPIGWVEERWIFIGAGIIYLQQSGETQLLLLGAVLSVCLGYLVVALSSLVSSQRRELTVLSALGWRPGHTARLFLSQALLLALGGGAGGIGLALLVVSLIGASPPWSIVAWTLPCMLVLALLSALYPLWQLGRIRPAEVLRAGSTVSSEHKDSWFARIASRLPAMSSFAVRNLTRSRVRSLIALGSLFLSALLLTVMVDGLLAFRETLQGTLLGDYVLLQTAIPQLAGAAFAVLLTFLSVADLLLLQVRERQREIGLLQATGWRLGMVQRMFVQEGLTLALVGTIPGVLVALGILLVRHATQSVVPVPIVGLGAVLLMMLVGAVATLPALRATTRMRLVDVLRTE